VTVGIPGQRLLAGEDVVVDVRPHIRTIAGPVTVALLVAVGTIGLCWRLRGDTSQTFPIGIAGTALVLFALAGPLLRWRTTELIVTTHRLILRRGVLARSYRDLPLVNIDGVLVERGLADRLLGTGTLIVQPARDTDEIVVPDVPRLNRVYQTVSELIDESWEYADDGSDGYLNDEDVETAADRRSR
jgi:uncharacterized membrane protein YdbT with pleckstrin-like domain